MAAGSSELGPVSPQSSRPDPALPPGRACSSMCRASQRLNSALTASKGAASGEGRMQSPRRAAGSANERAQSGRRRGTPLRETWLLVRPVPLVSGLLGEGEECYLSCWLSHGGGQREMLLKSITKTLAGLQFTLLGTRASRRCRRSVLRGCRDRSSPRHSVAPASEDPRLPPAAAAPGPGGG